MRVSQRATLDALNGRYLNTETGKINREYLNDSLQLILANTEKLYRGMHSKPRRKPTAITWEALSYLANEALKDEAYPAKPTRAASEHLKKWLADYGDGYETLTDTVEWVKSQQEAR